MANVQLPKFETTFGDIDGANLKGLQDIVKGLLNSTIILTEELTYLLNNLDTRNVNEIDGDILVTGTVTAAKILVEKLSAISADIGKVTAGEIYGNYIATRETGFPRAEMSNTNNLFKASTDTSKYIQVEASGSTGSPLLRFNNSGLVGLLYPLSGTLFLSTAGGLGDIAINSGQDLYLNALYNITVDSWGKLYSFAQGQTLKEALDSLSARITALGG